MSCRTSTHPLDHAAVPLDDVEILPGMVAA